MKLAQALKLRKDLTEKLGHAINNAKSAAFEPTAKPNAETLVARCFYLQEAIVDLSVAIDKANALNSVQFDGASDYRSLSSLRAERDHLTNTVTTLTTLAGVGSQTILRGSQTRDDEGKVVRTPDITIPVQYDLTAVSGRLNTYSKRIRLLDTALQQANWQVEVTCESANAEL